MDDVPAQGVEVRLFRRPQIRRRLLRQIGPDGRSGGQPRGLDAQGLEIAGDRLPHAEIVVPLRQMGPQPGEAGDHVPQGQARHAFAGHILGKGQSLRRGGGQVPLLLVRSGGAHQQVAVDRGRYQHALAHGAGQLENGPLHQAAVLLVQQAVFSPPGHDAGGVAADLVMEHVAPHTGGADNGPGLQRPLGRLQHIALPGAADGLHPGVEAELRAVMGGVLRQGDGHAEGADDGAGGGVQRGHGLLRQGGLQLMEPAAPEDLQALHAVGPAPLQKLLQPGQARLLKAHHQGPVPAIREVQLPGQRLHPAAALHVEPGLHRAGGGVEPGMNNGGIGLAGAHAYVLSLLRQADFQLPAAQLPGHGAAHRAAADDDGIVHSDLSFP